MTGFLCALIIEDIGTNNGKTIFRLQKPLVYLDGERTIRVPSGFETDLASVPRLPIVYNLWGNRAHREAVLHDYLYSIGATPDLPRKDCDELFRQAMISRGTPWWIYQPMYLGVRMMGWADFKKKPVHRDFSTRA